MWTNQYAHSTSASPEAVWQALSDVGRWAEWNAGATAIELDGRPASGTTFRMTLPDGQVLTSTIVAFVPGRELTDVTEVDGVSVRVVHLVEPDGAGTRIVYRVEASGAAPDDVLAEIGSGASSDMPELMAALAARAEAL